MKVGVLALQGDFESHQRRLHELGAETALIKKKDELSRIQGIVLPGGESSTLLRLMDNEFRSSLRDAIKAGLPTLATCAGLILIARRVTHPEQESLELLDIDVMRNGYGRQVDSFIEPALQWTADGKTTLQGAKLSPAATEAVFIRAPVITRVGASVKTLAECQTKPVLIQSGKILGATFHPELSSTAISIHKLFLERVAFSCSEKLRSIPA